MAISASRHAEHNEERIVALRREVAVLRAALVAVVGALEDQGVIDAEWLEERISDAVEAALRPRRPERRVDAVTPPVAAVRCVRCGREVPASSTVMLPAGPTCDRCPDA
jgi:hypothetical protein